jgi:hypothetical protein
MERKWKEREFWRASWAADERVTEGGGRAGAATEKILGRRYGLSVSLRTYYWALKPWPIEPTGA